MALIIIFFLKKCFNISSDATQESSMLNEDGSGSEPLYVITSTYAEIKRGDNPTDTYVMKIVPRQLTIIWSIFVYIILTQEETIDSVLITTINNDETHISALVKIEGQWVEYPDIMDGHIVSISYGSMLLASLTKKIIGMCLFVNKETLVKILRGVPGEWLSRKSSLPRPYVENQSSMYVVSSSKYIPSLENDLGILNLKYPTQELLTWMDIPKRWRNKWKIRQSQTESFDYSPEGRKWSLYDIIDDGEQDKGRRSRDRDSDSDSDSSSSDSSASAVSSDDDSGRERRRTKREDSDRESSSSKKRERDKDG